MLAGPLGGISKMKQLLFILIFLTTFISYGQTFDDKNETVVFRLIGELSEEQINNSGPKKLAFISNIDEAKKLAENDIEKGTPFLLLMSGVAPAIISTDLEFEKRYQVYLYEFGCSGPEDELAIAYNETIFEYMNNKFGETWTKQIRDDVVGFKEWRKK